MIHLALLPRDGLFLKDGRGWYTSDIGRSYSHAWPHPPTVRGALRAAYGHHLMQQTGQLLRPREWDEATADLTLAALIAMRRPAGSDVFALEHRLWPVPADVFHSEPGKARRLHPVEERAEIGVLDLVSGELDDQQAAFSGLLRPSLPSRAKPIPAPDFWTERDMRQWLLGAEDMDITSIHIPRRTDIHVTIDAKSQAATPSRLFSSDVTEPIDEARNEWALALACSLPAGGDATFASTSRPVLLGGRRRLALVEPANASLFAGPGDDFFARIAGSRGLRLVCVTPARFARGWLPDPIERQSARYCGELPGVDGPVVLRAALAGRPIDLSTWDSVARRPRPTWRLVRPGAVYFVEKEHGPFTAAECQRLWLAAWGGEQQSGLGLVIPGRWDPPVTKRG